MTIPIFANLSLPLEGMANAQAPITNEKAEFTGKLQSHATYDEATIKNWPQRALRTPRTFCFLFSVFSVAKTFLTLFFLILQLSRVALLFIGH
jgi:hypothetical protein